MTLFDRLRSRLADLRYFVPALAVGLGAILVHNAAVGVLLLTAEAMTAAAIAWSLGFDREGRFISTLFYRALPFLALLCLYAVLLFALTVYPLRWLVREQSLGATLALSTEVVVALLCLWRIWPAFGLLFVWKDVYPRRLARPPFWVAVQRCGALAHRISSRNELFFSHGLIVASCVLLQVGGALAFAWLAAALPDDMRLQLLTGQALIIAPLMSAIIVNRTADALLIERLRERGERHASVPAPAVVAAQVEVSAPDIPTQLTAAELNSRLLRCARAGQTELALAALAHGADPNAAPDNADRDQRSVLVLATLSPDMRLLRQLIARGVDLNRPCAGLTALIAATRDSHQGRPDAVMTLLTNGADPRCVDAAGNTPLHHAALSATPIVCALLCDASAPLDAVNRDGLTPLAMACSAGNWRLARFFLDRGAKAQVERAQPAVLGAAGVEGDDPSGVELLLRRKASVDALDALGRSALMVAAMRGNAAIAEALLEAGANTALADSRGTTALMEAARSGSEDVVDLVASRTKTFDTTDSSGRTALIIACQSRQAGAAIVRRLLDAGASPDVAGADGKSAVDFAAAAGRWNIVAMLDPAYSLPATIVESPVAAAPAHDSPQHLLDALRFGHWHIADTLAVPMRDWPIENLTYLYLALAEDDDATAPRLWLIDHGLQQRMCSAAAGDEALFAELLARLPNAAAAALEWHATGVSPAGASRLCLICAALPKATDIQRQPLEHLALAAIERGADVFAGDADARTPLAHAAASGNVRIVRALLERGVDPNCRDRQGRTPLFEALGLPTAAAQTLIAELIRAGANPEITSINGETPFGLALARPEHTLRRWLNWPLWKLPLRPVRDDDLPAAAMLGDADAVDKLLDLGVSVHATDSQGADALLRAAGGGHAPLVANLLGRGANPQRAAASGATPLSAAVTARRDAAVGALLAHGIPADQRLPTGGTPLMIAAALGFPEIIERLLAAGANGDAQDERGTRALHAAAQFAFRGSDTDGARRTLELLLKHGADVNATNAAGQTPLLLLLGGRAELGTGADQKHILGLLPVFLLAHADLDRQDQRGVGPLHACAMHGLLLPARALLAAHADPNRRDVLDRTARQLAHLLGYIDVAAELGAHESAAAMNRGSG